MMGMQQFGSLAIDHDGHRVLLGGQDVRLTRSEFGLLLALSSKPQVALSNREILEAMWGSSWQADTTPLQVYVSRLRRKIGESGTDQRYILTVHGFGYRFDPSPDGAAFPQSGHRVVELHVDEQLVLRDVRPRRTFLGWSVEEIIGTTFSPTGLEPDAIWGIIVAVFATGTRQLDGQINALSKDGSAHQIRGCTNFLLDDEGKFMGLLTRLYLPDD